MTLVHIRFLCSLCRCTLSGAAVKWQCCCDLHLVRYSFKKALQSNLEVVLWYNLGEIPLYLLFLTSFYLEVNPENCHVKEQVTFMTMSGLFPEICENRVSGQP